MTKSDFAKNLLQYAIDHDIVGELIDALDDLCEAEFYGADAYEPGWHWRIPDGSDSLH